MIQYRNNKDTPTLHFELSIRRAYINTVRRITKQRTPHHPQKSVRSTFDTLKHENIQRPIKSRQIRATIQNTWMLVMSPSPTRTKLRSVISNGRTRCDDDKHYFFIISSSIRNSSTEKENRAWCHCMEMSSTNVEDEARWVRLRVNEARPTTEFDMHQYQFL